MIENLPEILGVALVVACLLSGLIILLAAGSNRGL